MTLESKMSRRYFDLNIQRVLEHWTVSEALREIIANALDEQALTNTTEPEIFETDSGRWHVRDFGRGLRYEHFTQNEDAEKLAKPNVVIGKFGVGLKDAMATFDRHRVSVVIRSKHSDITIDSVAKHGFDDILTLHAVVDDPADSDMVGTEFILSGLKRQDVRTAQGLIHTVAERPPDHTGANATLSALTTTTHVIEDAGLRGVDSVGQGGASGSRAFSLLELGCRRKPREQGTNVKSQ